MLGVVVLLGLSWGILHLARKQDLSSLGFIPDKHITRVAFKGFLLSVLLCSAVQFCDMFLRDYEWSVNQEIGASVIFKVLYWDLISVVTEELVFRGALLYVLILWLGSKKAVLLSAAAFGIYHWFSFGVFGAFFPMLFVFVGTGLMGYAWALSFERTKSIFVPILFHFGWNATQNVLFSKGPLGNLVLLSTEGGVLTGALSLFSATLSMVIIPALMAAYVHYVVKPVESNI